MTGRVRYAYLEEQAVVFDDSHAYHLKNGHWSPLHIADAMSKAKLLTKSEFEAYAPDAPSLPSTFVQ